MDAAPYFRSVMDLQKIALYDPRHTQTKTTKTTLRPKIFDERSRDVFEWKNVQFSSSYYVFTTSLSGSHSV